MSRDAYNKLIAEDCPGSNPNKAKANKMRSFKLPKEFIEKGSSSKSKRTVNVFAAIVAESFAFVVSDFVRLVRMHIISRDVPWTQVDLEVDSPVRQNISDLYDLTTAKLYPGVANYMEYLP